MLLSVHVKGLAKYMWWKFGCCWTSVKDFNLVNWKLTQVDMRNLGFVDQAKKWTDYCKANKIRMKSKTSHDLDIPLGYLYIAFLFNFKAFALDSAQKLLFHWDIQIWAFGDWDLTIQPSITWKVQKIFG